ncbi:E3 ubiquitin-protein ligase DA2L-like [Tasmannia lanceolata]|uniref:E3 ubiquitin-protein ligase DA2L-like n=1 Tax=Tasmannia lanceolata TaxID=3420 RepID=UPI00406315B0
MGNSICRKKRSTVEDRLTRPQRLVHHPSTIDYKKLKKLILSEKLAPCFDGVEDSNSDLEECPICFFYYPSLNRSKCCMKGICTECFLQMKPLNPTRSSQCPFCKSSSYAVEYHGAKTQEQKSLEEAEEQKFIEAKIRMRSQESQNLDQVMLSHQISSDIEVQSPMSCLGDAIAQDARDSESDVSLVAESIDAAQSSVPHTCNGRHEDFDLDLEEIMMTEAIWKSLQDTSLPNTNVQSSGLSRIGGIESLNDRSNQSETSPALANQGEVSLEESVTGGLALAIARMTEHSIRNNKRTLDGYSVEEYGTSMPSNTCPNAIVLETGLTGTSVSPESDKAGSENGCLTSCSSTTDDDSWASLSARLLGRNERLETGFGSHDSLVMETIDIGLSCSSSVHSISDGSCGSPSCSNDVVGPSCSILSVPTTVERPLIVVSNFSR